MSLVTCGFAAGLEGLCAGTKVKAYFAELRWPRYSPPLWVWSLIGLLYYATFFFVLYRLLLFPLPTTLRSATIVLVLVMMLLNAMWNYVFFRMRKLYMSFVGTTLFPILDVALLWCLIQLESAAAWSLLPYLVYRVYSLWWIYRLWKMNRHTEARM